MLLDLRDAVRSFVSTPGLTAVLVITLALGIGANTAIFSAIDAVLLRPAPLTHLDDLAMVWETDRHTGTVREPASLPDYLDFGVMPDGADFGVLQILSAAAYSRGFADRGMKTRVDLWAPLQADPQELPRSTHPIFVLGRLAEATTHTAAQTELDAVSADLERAYPENAARGVHVESLSAVVFGPVRPAFFILLAAVVLVLLA